MGVGSEGRFGGIVEFICESMRSEREILRRAKIFSSKICEKRNRVVFIAYEKPESR